MLPHHTFLKVLYFFLAFLKKLKCTFIWLNTPEKCFFGTICTFYVLLRWDRSVWNAESDLVKLMTFKTFFSFDFLIFLLMVLLHSKSIVTLHTIIWNPLQHAQRPCPAHEMRLHTIMCKILVKFPHVTTLRIFLCGIGNYKMKWLHKFDWTAIFFEKKVLSRNLAFILDIAKRSII